MSNEQRSFYRIVSDRLVQVTGLTDAQLSNGDIGLILAYLTILKESKDILATEAHEIAEIHLALPNRLQGMMPRVSRAFVSVAISTIEGLRNRKDEKGLERHEQAPFGHEFM